MYFLGDVKVGRTLRFAFDTQADGLPSSLSATTVRVYKDASTVESSSGITLTADYDARTGLNHVAIDTSSDGAFYSSGSDFMVVLTAGTLNGQSIMRVLGNFSIENRTIGFIKDGIIAAATFAANALDAVWSTATRVLTAGTNIVLAKGTGVTGFTDLDAPGVRSAVGLASANLDTQLGTIAGYIDTEVAAIKAKTDQLTFTNALKVDAAFNAAADLPQAAADKVWSSATRTLTSSAGVKKNTGLNAFEFFMADSADHVTGKTGVSIAATRSLDGAAFGACANAPTEVGSGVYKIDLAAADLNGDVVTLKFSGSGADATVITIKTAP